MITFPNLTATWAEQQIYDLYSENERRRLESYRLGWEAYNGILPYALKVKAGSLNDNVRVSKCRVIVDTGVSSLFGENVTFSLDTEKARSPAEQWLDKCWNANRKMTLLGKLGTNGAVCGHAFLKIVPNYPATDPFPRLIVLDPANVIVAWDDDDIEQVKRYIIQWKAINPTTAKPVMKRQVIERQGVRWVMTDYEQQVGRVSTDWRLIRQEIWGYSWPPVIDCQNIPVPNEFFGESDIPLDIIDLNRSRNFTLSNWARVIKNQAHQRLWGKGFRDDQVKMGADEIFIIESEAGQLNAIDPNSDMSGIETFDRRLDDALHEVSRTPAIAMGKLEGIGAISGVALKIAYAPLEQKTQTKRRTYGDMLNELNRRLLELGDYGSTNETTIEWPSIVPNDDAAESQALTQDAALGIVSKSTMATRRGYDWDAEQQAMAQETTTGEGDDASALPTEDEANRLKVSFEALKAAVDAGIPLEVLLEKYLGWTPAEVNEVTAEAEAEDEANALEARERMDAMRQGGIIGQQPGQAPQAPSGIGPAIDGPTASGDSGNGQDAG